MKLPKRFALSTLLLAMLFASLVFGFVEYRRQHLVIEAQSLASKGAYLTDFRTGWFWPTAGTSAYVFKYGLNEQEIGEIELRLHALGVTRIRWDANREPGK